MKNRQSGMSLLEILAAIAVGTVLFIGLTDMIDVSLEDAKGQQAAHHQAQLVNAAQKYIAENYADLMDQTSTGTVKAINVLPDLRPFLPYGFVNQNTYRQSTCVLVRQNGGKLNALVVTYDGMQIPDRSIAAVAMNAGQGAGYINTTDFGRARGPSWSFNTTPYRNVACAGGIPLAGGEGDAGHLVSNIFYDGPGRLSTDFLYRDPVPDRPELNRMNVPLQMGNAGLVDLGDGCGSQIALAIENTTRDVVVCDSGKWRYTTSSWKEPVSTYGALASVPKKDGDVRVALNTGRAFVYDSGTNRWNALAIDQNGDLSVPRDLAVAGNLAVAEDLDVARYMRVTRDMRVSGNLTVEDTFIASGDIRAMGDVDIANKLTARGDIDAKKDIDVVGYMHAAEVRGKWMAADVIVLDGIENPGGPCHFPGTKTDGTPVVINPVGTTLRDTTGRLLTCNSDRTFKYQNGTYVP